MNKIKFFLSKIERSAKEKKDFIVLPLNKLLCFFNIAPWQITLFSFIIGLAAAISLNFSRNIFLILILTHFLLDQMDGSLARYRKIQSEGGWWLDNLSDRMTTLLIMISAGFILGWNYFTVGLILIYILVTALYFLKKRDYQIIQFEILLYYPLVYISLILATIFYFWVYIINLLIIFAWFLVFDFKK